MSHNMLRPFIIKVSLLGYFPLPSSALDRLYIIDQSIR